MCIHLKSPVAVINCQELAAASACAPHVQGQLRMMLRKVEDAMLRAHGVVVSHPLRMRKALGSNPSVSIWRTPITLSCGLGLL